MDGSFAMDEVSTFSRGGAETAGWINEMIDWERRSPKENSRVCSGDESLNGLAGFTVRLVKVGT
ncbi:Uncharacterised protein [Chlamydia abortus]|nr:Uncharacterised protein [Chlamydia abortus]